MKPDWKDAPEWANYLAMDDDGEWCWYEERPVPRINFWVSDGRYCLAGYGQRWDRTLEDRPETK